MMQLKREIKILTLFLAMAYGAFTEAQRSVSATQTTTNTMPANPDRADMITGTMLELTAPSEVTTVNPMDPINDSRRTTDSPMLNIRRKRATAPPASATTWPAEVAPTY